MSREAIGRPRNRAVIAAPGMPLFSRAQDLVMFCRMIQTEKKLQGCIRRYERGEEPDMGQSELLRAGGMKPLLLFRQNPIH
jgi:hypothetical protein